MSLSKSKCWYSNICLHFFKAHCSIRTIGTRIKFFRTIAFKINASITNAIKTKIGRIYVVRSNVILKKFIEMLRTNASEANTYRKMLLEQWY
jgi:hypothetical protein